MADFTIASVSINTDGWSADVVLTGEVGQATKITYAYGLGVDNDPTNAAVVFTVTSQGYDATGTLGTVERTVYGTQTVRQAYANEALLDETDSGGDLLIRMALSEFIYDDDTAAGSGTATTVAIAAGWATDDDDSDESLAFSGDVTVNNSTLDYPKVIGHFAVPDRVPVNGLTDIEVFAVHAFATDGKPVAMVKITATGADSSHVETSADITAMTLSNRGDLIPVYAASMDLSVSAGFTLGEVIAIDFTAYPWIGDATSVLNSTTDAGTQIFQLNPLTYTIMDKMIAVVDGVGGGTPVASPIQAEADAAPYDTIANAIAGIAAQNAQAPISLNRIDGGEVQLKADNYGWAGGTGTSLNGYFTITHHSSTNQAGVIFDASVTNTNQKEYQRFYDVTFTRAGNGFQVFAGASDVLLMESINFNDAFTGWYSGVADSNIEFLDCTYNNAYVTQGGNDGHSRLHRNCTYTATNQTSRRAVGSPSCLLGFGCDGMDSTAYDFITSSGFDNKIIGYSKFINCAEGILQEKTDGLTNIALINNLYERVGASASPALELTTDAGAEHSNIVSFNNSYAGQRFNHENDITAPGVNGTFVNYIGKNNIFNARGDHRADIIATDGLLVGTWSVGYSVGWESNHNEAISYSGDTDFWGLNSNIDTGTDSGTAIEPPAPVGYVDDASKGDTDLGNGDYHLDTGSSAIGLASDILMPFDIEGTARFIDSATNGGAVGAYEFGTDTPPSTGFGLRPRYAGGSHRPRYNQQGRYS